ncbi:unnamed protein product [Arctia plantaginis]|nr:unnamed protein product [Arctia plantaginis]
MDLVMKTVVENPSWMDFFQGAQSKKFIFEDEQCFVIDEENNKQAPIHFLVVPKKTIARLADASVDDEKLLGHMLIVAKQVALDMGIDRTGYHVMVDENHRENKLKALHVFGRALHHMV